MISCEAKFAKLSVVRCTITMHRAFTLIELLAVIVIISMIAGVGLISLSSADTEATLQRIGFEWRELDGKLRIVSQRDPASRLSLRINDNTITGEGATDELSQLIIMPHRVEAQLLVDDAVESIAFDRRGCSSDYTLVLSLEQSKKQWQVFGLTGWIHEVSSDREGDQS